MGLPGECVPAQTLTSSPGPFLGWVCLAHPRRLLLRLGACRGREAEAR